MRTCNKIKLANTKFRIHRIRLSLGIIFSSLLLSVLAIVAVLFLTVPTQLSAFFDGNILSKYLVYAKQPHQTLDNSNPEVIKLAKQYYEAEKIDAKNKLQAAGLNFSDGILENPIQKYQDGTEYVATYTKSGQKALEDYYDKTLAHYSLADLTKLSTDIISTATYESYRPINGKLFSLQGGENLKTVLGEREYHATIEDAANDIQLVNDNPITDKFLIENYALNQDEIPIIISYQTAAELLNQDLETQNIDARYNSQKQIRASINQNSFSMCFRNDASINDITSALTDSQDAKVKYAVNNGECQGTSIKQDNRTNAEKQADLQNQQALKLLGAETAKQQIVKFRVIGLYESTNYSTYLEGGLTLKNVPSMLSDTNFPFASFLVLKDKLSAQQQELLASIYEKTNGVSALESGNEQYMLEFKDYASAKAYIDNHNSGDPNRADVKFSGTSTEKPFSLSLAGGQSIIIAEVKKQASRLLAICVAIIAIICAIIVYLILNRTLLDSRKETAIYRAIGYTRKDIFDVYAWYVIRYAVTVSLIAIVISTIVMSIAQVLFAPEITVYLNTLFRTNQEISFSFAIFDPRSWLLVPFTIIICLIASILPLAPNTRRSIAKDLRAE